MSKGARAVAIILGVYAVLLFSALSRTPLWLDEIQQFGNRRGMPLAEFIRWIQLNAGASPLPYLLQRTAVDWLGYSAFPARLPSAIASLLAAVVFAAICPRVLQRGRWIALIFFLALPIQFRYGVEARVYSQGLFFSLLSFWLFLRVEQSRCPSFLYGLSAAAGLYSQPLTIFPALAQAIYAFPKRRVIAVWMAAAVLAYLPWYIPQHRAQLAYAVISPPTTFFNWRQIAPRILLHDFTGGGYWCAFPLLALALWGAVHPWKNRRLVFWMLGCSIAGPILMDLAFNYFFAERQLLYAMPALIILAAQGFERAPKPAACLLAGILLLSAAIKDYRQATVPRDDLNATADAIVSHLPADACVLAQPPEQIAFYLFFHPELSTRVCSANFANLEVVAVASVYTTAAEARLPSDLVPIQTTKIGASEITLCRRRP